MMQVLDFLLNIIKTPAIILAIVALIGLSLQGKKFSEVFSGTIKTALGMLIISAGAMLIVKEILPFVDLFAQVFNLHGFATSSEAVVGAMQSSVPLIASTSSLILGIGFLVNIVLARISPLKYIFLTGHMMWILSVILAGCLYLAGLNETLIIVIGSILQGLIMVILPAIAQPFVRKLTGSDSFALGHLTNIGTVFASYIGGKLGNKEKSAEDVKLPEALEFFKDTSMSVAIAIGVFYLFIVILAGPAKVASYSNGTNFIVFGILKSLGFTAGILILLQGVRMFLGELVPAFKGISDKIVPGAIPALDVPVIFAFAPNSLMIGFITSVVGMIVGMIASSFAFGVVPLVSIIGAFFTGGVAGIFGNVAGGRIGAIVSGFIYGFALIFLSGFTFTIFDYAQFHAVGVGLDCIDAMCVVGLLKNVYVGVAIIVIAFFALCVIEVRRQKKLAACNK